MDIDAGDTEASQFDAAIDLALIAYVLSVKGDTLLTLQDEAYGNTPLHVACANGSTLFAKTLLTSPHCSDASKLLGLKNLVDKTAKEIVCDLITKMEGYVD